MDDHRGHGRHSRRASLGGWWTIVLGIVLAVRLLLYLLEVGST